MGESSLSSDSESNSSSSQDEPGCEQPAGGNIEAQTAEVLAADSDADADVGGEEVEKEGEDAGATNSGGVPVNATQQQNSAEAKQQTHVIIRKLARRYGWPDGPLRMEDLFHWQEYNANTLLNGKEATKDRLNRVISILSRDFDISESYAGTGNGATTLHQQFTALNSAVQKVASEAFGGQIFRQIVNW